MITGKPFALTEYVQNAAMVGEDPAKRKKLVDITAGQLVRG